MPSLTAYQRALAGAIQRQEISAADTAMLDAMSAPGLSMTSRVRASWCKGRSRRAARLTLSALAEIERERLVNDWIARGGGTSSFFEAEAEAFLTFIASRLETPSHAASLCRFERALIRSRAVDIGDEGEPVLDGASMICRSPDADLVEFHAPIDALLDAMAGKRPWPIIGRASHSLLIAPGIAGKVRDASAAEIALWAATATPVTAGPKWPIARSLVAAGVLMLISAPRSAPGPCRTA